jgi:hypothetical protein
MVEESVGGAARCSRHPLNGPYRPWNGSSRFELAEWVPSSRTRTDYANADSQADKTIKLQPRLRQFFACTCEQLTAKVCDRR